MINLFHSSAALPLSDLQITTCFYSNSLKTTSVPESKRLTGQFPLLLLQKVQRSLLKTMPVYTDKTKPQVTGRIQRLTLNQQVLKYR